MLSWLENGNGKAMGFNLSLSLSLSELGRGAPSSAPT